MGDDFFLCSGHSLLATRLVFEIQQRTRVKIARRDIFRTPTLRGQGGLVADQVPRGFDVVARKLS
jgi:Phosphopantetheine attachment site